MVRKKLNHKRYMSKKYFIVKIVKFKSLFFTDLEESEGKMSQIYKSMEMKQVEVER